MVIAESTSRSATQRGSRPSADTDAYERARELLNHGPERSQLSTTRTVVVVPCFNETHRLNRETFLGFDWRTVELLFVDDGSTDDTRAALELLCLQLRARGVEAHTLVLGRNGGKGDAIRCGMLSALEHGASTLGYLDADLATPPMEMVRLVETLTTRSVDVVLGSRVVLLGTAIHRRSLRHYLGRLFATAASLVLQMPVYDTQCGAKVFRHTAALEHALAQPFSGRWAFDVELLGRLHAGTSTAPGIPMDRFVEVPLSEWRDMPGSTLRGIAFPLLAVELIRIALALRAWSNR
jgi:dolichyl-phosphate beta-glucosyltransferase